MLKTVGKKMGLVDKELGQFKKCIDKVPFLAECVVTEKDRVKRVNRPAAASAESTLFLPLLSGQDEGSCSQENLNREITRLKKEGDMPTLELIICYRNLRDNPEFNRQIEESRHKDVYKKICLVLNRLAEEEKREEEKREAAELNSLIEHGHDYNRAVLLYEKCLATSKRDLGEDHLDTLKLLKKLANFFSQQGTTMNRAVPLFEEILARNRRVLGDDHPDTLESLNTLAAVLQVIREFDRAVPLYEELLTKQRRILGDDHPDTLQSLQSLNNLANTIRKKGEFDRAFEILARNRRVLGDNHPDTLNSLEKLAALFMSKGEYDRAEPLYEEILARNRRLLGDYHPDTLESLRNLALLLNSKGEYDRALPLLQEWMANREQKQTQTQTQTQTQAQAQAPVPIEIQSTTLPTLPNSTLPNSTGGKSKNKRNHKNKSFRSTRRRRYSRARGGKKIAALSSKTIKRRRKNAR